jgi:hypothetical protein
MKFASSDDALVHEVQLPTFDDKVPLGMYLCELPKCIRFIDGILIEILAIMGCSYT